MNSQLQQQTLNEKIKSVPNMGNHLQLDFIKLNNISDFNRLNNFFTETLERLGSQIDFANARQEGDIAISYILNNGSFTIHTFNNENLTLDLHLTETTQQGVKRAEEIFCDYFGWKNCTNFSILKRGQTTSYFINDFLDKAEILRNVELIHRERTQFQELRIYDTLAFGRILVLDGAIQNCPTLNKVDNYTIDLTRLAIDSKERVYNHAVIIGGGDLLIAVHILKEYPNVKRLTLCDLDHRVVEMTRKYFGYAAVVNKELETGRFEIIFNGGAAYMEQLLSEGKQGTVDAVIVDCTDFCLDENSIAAELFSPKFYKTIYELLSEKSGFSQQITRKWYTDAFTERVNLGGFGKVDVFDSIVPEYGGEAPLAYCFK